MNVCWIIIIGMCIFLLGFSMGASLGLQKGQYILFEGLEKVFEGSEININVNETLLLDGFENITKEIVNDIRNLNKPDMGEKR